MRTQTLETNPTISSGYTAQNTMARSKKKKNKFNFEEEEKNKTIPKSKTTYIKHHN